MNKKELVAQMSAESGMTKQMAEGALNAFYDVVLDTLKKGDEVRLVGFGTFKVAHKKETTARNPKTQELIKVPASNKPTFKAGKEFVDILNN